MASEHAAQLIGRYVSKGLLLDANMLLVYCVGRYQATLLPSFKRTRLYGVRDFRLIADIVARFARLVTTPNVLTEVSNLALQLRNDHRRRCFRRFIEEVELLEERYIESARALRNGHAERLGLTDAAIIEAARKKLLVLTADVDLYLAMCKEGVDCINYNHIRPLHRN